MTQVARSAEIGGWDVSDAWILGAVGGFGRPCTLTDLIAAATAINETIPSAEVLESALGKLTGAGLARVFENWTFELTDEGSMVWSGDFYDIRAHLKSAQDQLANFEPGRTAVKLPRGLMDQAVAEYCSR